MILMLFKSGTTIPIKDIMNQYDSVLKMYSDSGLRTVEDWTIRGRDIEAGATPRADATLRGVVMPLYSRDQTHHRDRVDRKKII